jgi:hypothetical protein
MTLLNSNPRCQGQTKSGKPCRAAATLVAYASSTPTQTKLLSWAGSAAGGIAAQLPPKLSIHCPNWTT